MIQPLIPTIPTGPFDDSNTGDSTQRTRLHVRPFRSGRTDGQARHAGGQGREGGAQVRGRKSVI
jgi:hypothetical protein